VLLYGRQFDRPWGMPVVNTAAFRLTLNPWPAAFGDDPTNPGFNLTRFNLEHWQRFERTLDAANQRGIEISVIFFIGGQPLPTPFAELSEDEYRYYRYAAARLSAFANVQWDLGNEGDFHRVPYHHWTRTIADAMAVWDPYRHILGSHNQHLPAGWHGNVQLLQHWDAGLNKLCLERKATQLAHGRQIPHIIEEYGYEDLWEKTPGQRSADSRRRIAWEIAMAGCYSTTGETAARGTGVDPDTGGGWVNGRGDERMTLLDQLAPLPAFFTSFHWWKLEPANALIQGYDRAEPALCLAENARRYVLYLPRGGSAELRLAPGTYNARRFDPRTGEWQPLPDASAEIWNSPAQDGEQDWVFLLSRAE
jgi:hypothetical protein